jgi:hypothetical protein
MSSVCSFWLVLFDDKRLLSALLAVWTIISSVIFVMIMLNDGSKFLTCGPNTNNLLFGVALDTWSKWWAVALYTFFSTCIAAFSGDAIWPFLTNVIMDPKTKYIPYSKMTCLTIIQVQTIYGTCISKAIRCLLLRRKKNFFFNIFMKSLHGKRINKALIYTTRVGV